MDSLFSNDYLPDRIDLLLDRDSIGYMEFLETQKRKNNISFLNKAIKLIFTKG